MLGGDDSDDDDDSDESDEETPTPKPVLNIVAFSLSRFSQLVLSFKYATILYLSSVGSKQEESQ